MATAFVSALGLGYWLGHAEPVPFLRGGRLAAFQPAKAQEIPVHPEVINLQEAFANVAEAVKPAVVSITTVHVETMNQAQDGQPYEFYFGDPFEQFFEDFFGGSPQGQPRRQAPAQRRPIQRKFEGMGSGVIIDPQGYVLTNDHVVSDADEIKVILSDGKKTYQGKVIGRDPRTDLAVVKIKADGKLPSAPLGDSGKVRIGDWAIAIGSPFGLQQTLTVGVISALNQSLQIENRTYKDFIQTDAAINRGNSGGPLVNIRGEVIGVNTAIFAPTGVFAGIGFAIPINDAKEVLDDLIHKGKVVRGWLGVELAAEIDGTIAKNFGLPDQNGALVNKVFPDSPASKAGLQRGDVVRTFGGTAVKDRDQLVELVTKTPPKKKVPAKIIRNGKPMDLIIVLSERPDWVDSGKAAPGSDEEKAPSKDAQSWKGLSLETLDESLADELGLKADETGVVVTDVDGKSPLANHIAAGDLIKSLNRTPTPDVKAFLKAAQNVSLSKGALFDIIRDGRPLYISVTLQK